MMLLVVYVFMEDSVVRYVCGGKEGLSLQVPVEYAMVDGEILGLKIFVAIYALL